MIKYFEEKQNKDDELRSNNISLEQGSVMHTVNQKTDASTIENDMFY